MLTTSPRQLKLHHIPPPSSQKLNITPPTGLTACHLLTLSIHLQVSSLSHCVHKKRNRAEIACKMMLNWDSNLGSPACKKGMLTPTSPQLILHHMSHHVLHARSLVQLPIFCNKIPDKLLEAPSHACAQHRVVYNSSGTIITRNRAAANWLVVRVVRQTSRISIHRIPCYILHLQIATIVVIYRCNCND